MRRLMTKDGCVSGSIAKRLEGRHLDVIHDRRVIGLVAAVPDHGAGVAEEEIGARYSLDRIPDLGRRGMIGVGQTVDLLDIEHRIGL